MKMHGLGNDFVVLDARAQPVDMTPALAQALADRNRGVGFDQLAVISDGQDAHLTFYNADGSLSSACGNATRCIARMMMNHSGRSEVTLTTDHGALLARDAGSGLTSVNMGPLESFGPRYEHHPLYPQRTNVQIAQIIGPDHIRMRVWERGTGITLASGSSSCAWADDGVWMTGPTAHVFSGTLTEDWLAQAQ